MHPLPELRPPAEADNVAYFRHRLADPRLVDRGVTIVFDYAALLAVPVGGQRRGGFLAMGDIGSGLAVRTVLDGRPGYPHVRLVWSADPEVCHHVAWGDRPPSDDKGRGYFYGYGAGPVAEFLDRSPAAAQGPALMSQLAYAAGPLELASNALSEAGGTMKCPPIEADGPRGAPPLAGRRLTQPVALPVTGG